MTLSYYIKTALVVVAALLGLAFLWAPTTISTVQRGPDGTGMELVLANTRLEAQPGENVVPPPLPLAEGAESEENYVPSSEAYQNVQVLGNVSSARFTRFMLAMTQWVSPEQGCNYCHNPENMASDEVYAKVVSRRMIQMSQYINENWQTHVEGAGVTCYTCHRGQPVPQYIWFTEPERKSPGLAGNRAGQNQPHPNVAMASLPADPFTPFLLQANNIRVLSTNALPSGNRTSIKQTEWTYGLMMHMSTSLGVNCTYCHNSRSVAMWNQSPPTRATAWYGIRMVRELNNEYLTPLRDTYPPHRWGPTGDAPKANCATCHQGVYKPLLGQNMLRDYPLLSRSDMYEEDAEAYRQRKAKAEEEAAAAAAAAEAEAEGDDTDGDRPAEDAPSVDELK